MKKFSSFKVHNVFIRASDIPAYLNAGPRATPIMRRKTFMFWERLALIPTELVAAFKASVILMLLFFLTGGLGGPGGYWDNAVNYGLLAAVVVLATIIAGAVVTPFLLPVLPGRAFSVKGCIAGMTASIILMIMRNPDLAIWQRRLETLG